MKPAFALILGVVVMASGCGEKPVAKAPESEVRGQPIAPVTTKVPTAPPFASNGAAVAVAPLSPATPTPAVVAPEFALAGFDILSGYNIEVSDELLGPVTNDLAAVTAKTEALIPTAVKALNQKRVALKGFMLPLKVEGGLVTEMLIMKDQSMCCYGSTPKLNEWVSIKMTGAGVKAIMDQPVTLFGKLHVGEMRENGYLVGIYRMDGEKMQGPEE